MQAAKGRITAKPQVPCRFVARTDQQRSKKLTEAWRDKQATNERDRGKAGRIEQE